MSCVLRNALGATLAITTLVINPAFLIGCGSCLFSDPGEPYSNEEVEQEYSKLPKNSPLEYSITAMENDGPQSAGTLAFTLTLDAGGVAALERASDRTQQVAARCSQAASFVQSASACDLVAPTAEISISGTFTAIHTPTDGDPITLYQDEPFEGGFVIDGLQGNSPALIELNGNSSRRFSFTLFSQTEAKSDQFRLEFFSDSETDVTFTRVNI